MEAYTDFAGVYDIFMDDTPYGEWAEFLASQIETYGPSKPVRGNFAPEKGEDGVLASERNLVVDLGCGTGTLTELLAGKGYDMIGVDNSQEMLEAALFKKQESQSEILYLCQDMRELNLYSTVGTVISVCDSVNYLLEDEDVEKTFSLVNNYLYPGGLFIFDFNTVYKYGQVIGDATIAENREDCSFIWENYYHEGRVRSESGRAVPAAASTGTVPAVYGDSFSKGIYPGGDDRGCGESRDAGGMRHGCGHP